MSTFESIREFVVPGELCDATDRQLCDAGLEGDERFVLWSGVVRDDRMLVRTSHCPEQTAYRLAGGLSVRVEADELHRLNVWLYENAERLAIQVHSTPHGGLSFGYRRRLSDGDYTWRLVARSTRLRQVRRSRTKHRTVPLVERGMAEAVENERPTRSAPGRLTMAIPDYFQRNAVAVSQVISGLDEQRLASRLANVGIGVTIGPDADGDEGRAMTDLLVRLLARFYPSIIIRLEGAGRVGNELHALARRINPRISLSGKATIEAVIGTARPRWKTARTVFAGCAGWDAMLSTNDPQRFGASNNPFGAGLGACLVAAEVFRHVFLPGAILDGECEIGVPNAGEWASDEGNVAGTSAT